MPPKNSAERQRKYVEKLKADGKYEEFKEKKAEYRNEYNRKKRDSMTPVERNDRREYERKKKALYRYDFNKVFFI